MIERVIATPAALELIEELRAEFGPVMFHQSGGCCDGSAANCYKLGELMTGPADMYLGEIGGAPFYMGKLQFDYWKHTQLIIDVVNSSGGGTFSLEGGKGRSFHTRSRVFTDEECAELEAREAAQTKAP